MEIARVPIEAARLNVDRLGIKYDELPPRPFWTIILGKSERHHRLTIAAKVMGSSSMIGRELTPPETDALAQHYAAMLNTSDYESPLTLVASSIIWWRTQHKYSFPFWTPNPSKFNPHKIFGRQGLMAPRIWHSLRYVAWWACCKSVIGIFVLSSAISAYQRNYMTDTRLVEYRQDVHEARAKSRGAKPEAQHGQHQVRHALPVKEESFESWPSTDQNAQDAQDAQSSFSATQKPLPENIPDQFQADDPYAFDDASLVAPAEQQRYVPQQSAQGGSAWDRIRKGTQAQTSSAAAGQGSGQQTSAWGRKREEERTSRGAQDGSSYTYSSGDEQKSYPKEQSQKEFDEMLERERRGEASGRR